jgi:hypothetical protein
MVWARLMRSQAASQPYWISSNLNPYPLDGGREKAYAQASQ